MYQTIYVVLRQFLSTSNFKLSQGAAFAIIYQRVASAPYFSMVSNGSTALPKRLLILFPFLSNTKPLDTTFIYATESKIHCCNSMQCKRTIHGLINTLCNKVFFRRIIFYYQLILCSQTDNALAHKAAPESNGRSIKSGSRNNFFRSSLKQYCQRMVYVNQMFRSFLLRNFLVQISQWIFCHHSFNNKFSIFFFNSSALPITICSVLSSLVQIGIGMPQKRERDKFNHLNSLTSY